MTVERYRTLHAASTLAKLMDLFNSYNLLTLGRAFQRFDSLENGATRASTWIHAVHLKEAIDALSGAGGVRLAVSARPIGILQNLLQNSGFLEFPGTLGGEPAEWAEVLGIQYAIRDVDTVLAAELGSVGTYAASPKQAYNVLTLIYEGEALIPGELISVLPTDAVADLRQCGKCLAFELPTAAGFHVARATEAVLLAFLDSVVTSRPTQPNWGQYIQHMEAKGVDRKITSFVKLIKDTYRNPVIHPEITLSGTEAEVLVNACVAVMTLMLIEIRAMPSEAVSGAGSRAVE